jgi:hypothetical protein
VVTLAPALEHVTLALILLGSASGPAERLVALHGSRLEMLLTRMLDTTVRGILYESAGSVERSILGGGAERVRIACERSLIPYALLAADPADHAGWLKAAGGAVAQLLEL